MGTKEQLEDGRIDMPDLVVSVGANVPPERIYATLADLSTHTTWAGSMHGKKNFGLRTLEASVSPAVVGTEFRSTGADPMGSFTDRSVVTEASDPSVFEFVTEGHLEPEEAGEAILRHAHHVPVRDRAGRQRQHGDVPAPHLQVDERARSAPLGGAPADRRAW